MFLPHRIRRRPPVWRVPCGLRGQARQANGASERLGGIVLGLGSVGLVGMSVWPDYLYPMVWIAPLLILTAWPTLLGRPTIFALVQHGDWRSIWLWALAALVCDGFWEMWNTYSLAKWVYAVPFVNRFHLFEMPLLGYGAICHLGWSARGYWHCYPLQARRQRMHRTDASRDKTSSRARLTPSRVRDGPHARQHCPATRA
jgi:hypothetical protein